MLGFESSYAVGDSRARSDLATLQIRTARYLLSQGAAYLAAWFLRERGWSIEAARWILFRK